MLLDVAIILRRFFHAESLFPITYPRHLGDTIIYTWFGKNYKWGKSPEAGNIISICFFFTHVSLKVGVHKTTFSAREENALEFFPHQRIGEFPNRAAFPLRCLLQEENSAFSLRKSVLFCYQTVSFPLSEFLYHTRAQWSKRCSIEYQHRKTYITCII